jgi:hypothetical protein
MFVVKREARHKRRTKHRQSWLWVPACAGTTAEFVATDENYASPSVSNIAALIASAAVLPAQTTNWKAG